MLRFHALSLGAFAIACSAMGVAATTACLTAPPPDVSQGPAHPPHILHDQVQPPPDQILAELPTEFLVPVELDDPNQNFYWDVFVDYDPVSNPDPVEQFFPSLVEVTPGTLDGGVATVSFDLRPVAGTVLDPTRCHLIECLVAHGFNNASPHTWDSVGGDIVTWTYNPGGGPGGCPVYDAGSLQDGAFPAQDSSSDTLPVVPESGSDP